MSRLNIFTRGRRWLSRSLSTPRSTSAPAEVVATLSEELPGNRRFFRRRSKHRTAPAEQLAGIDFEKDTGKKAFDSPIPAWQGASAAPDLLLPEFDAESSISTKYLPSEKTGTTDTDSYLHPEAGPRHTPSSCSNSQPASPSTPRADEEAVKREVYAAVAEASAVRPWTGKQYQLLRTLENAERNQGKVQLMMQIDTGRFAAVKQMPIKWTTSGPAEFLKAHPKSQERPWLDIGIVKYLEDNDFPYVCKFFGVYQDVANTYFVSSYASEKDLFTWAGGLPSVGPQREAVCRPVIRQLFVAVRWLHDLGIAHRDISLENVVLTVNDGFPEVKLIDFSMASMARRCESGVVPGKPSYQAPEMHVEGEYDAFMADTFAVGVMTLAMVSFDVLWKSTRPGECEAFMYAKARGLKKFLSKREACDHPGERLVDFLSDSFIKLASGLLAPHPRQRLTLGERCYSGDELRHSVWTMHWLS